MKLSYHTAASLTISGILYLTFKSWGMALSCLIAGIFIDLDHFIDVAREHGWPFKIKKFSQVCNESQFNQIVLVLHGWEWLALSGIAAWMTNWNPWITGVFAGLSTHLVLDALHNSNNVLTYSLLWRWKKGFHFDTIFSNLKSVKYKYQK